jgi:hypothetical protein
MNDALERMLALVEERTRADCEAALGEARTAARRLIAESRREARERVHTKLTEARAAMESRIREGEAAFDTARRQHAQQRDQALLAAAWPLLRAALAKRWQDARTRSMWTRALIDQALAVMPRARWEIACPQGYSAAEREALAAQVKQATQAAPALIETADIDAGLRVSADGASLDGTIEGLLADRAAIEGRLLAEVAREEPKAESSEP